MEFDDRKNNAFNQITCELIGLEHLESMKSATELKEAWHNAGSLRDFIEILDLYYKDIGKIYWEIQRQIDIMRGGRKIGGG